MKQARSGESSSRTRMRGLSTVVDSRLFFPAAIFWILDSPVRALPGATFGLVLGMSKKDSTVAFLMLIVDCYFQRPLFTSYLFFLPTLPPYCD